MIELQDVEDGEIIAFDDDSNAVERELKPTLRSPSTRKDKFCGCICVLGLLLVLISGFFLLPVSTVFAVYSEGGEILNVAEDALKDEGLEALRNQISQLDIPPIEGQQNVLAATISYTISDFVVNDFDFNFDDVNFDITSDGFSVDSKKDSVTVGFNWEFETKAGISDNGTGDAITDNMNLYVEFSFKTATSLKVEDCTLKLKDLEINFYADSGDSWLYDAAVNLFKTEVTKQIEDQVCDKLDGQVFEF